MTSEPEKQGTHFSRPIRDEDWYEAIAQAIADTPRLFAITDGQIDHIAEMARRLH